MWSFKGTATLELVITSSDKDPALLFKSLRLLHLTARSQDLPVGRKRVRLKKALVWTGAVKLGMLAQGKPKGQSTMDPRILKI